MRAKFLTLTPQVDQLLGDTFVLCIGYGCVVSLKIGIDVEQVPGDLEKCICHTSSHNVEGNYYLVRHACPVHRGVLK